MTVESIRKEEEMREMDEENGEENREAGEEKRMKKGRRGS